MNKELASDIVGSISASVVVGRVDGGEENAVELGDIGDEEVSVLVFNPGGAIRQNDNRDTVVMSVRDKSMAEEFSADTFFVIGEDNGVDTAAECVMNEGAELIEEAVGVVCIVIEVKSKYLVIFSDDAGFGGSRVVREDEPARRNVELEE